MRILFFLALLSVGIALAEPAFAATVEPLEGRSLLNRGAGYKLLKGATTGRPGDTVMANVASSAVITYSDGCKEEVKAGEVVAIKKESPCRCLLQHQAENASADQAYTAVVDPEQGRSLIDRGSGYKVLVRQTPGRAGDTVTANQGGSAVIIYRDGCKERVKATEVVTIKEVSPCKCLLPHDYALLGAAAVGATVGAAVLSDDDAPASP